ncbi:MAG TPA: transposase [Pyrinomonadaceae bacterium]|nr:transposase [Pyrinomonadaceae bacterium]
MKKSWCIGEINSEFIAAMEDVLNLYAEDFDSLRPVVCFDETSKQLVRELRVAISPSCGQVERFDYEYKRNGVANLFMMCQPKAGWRHVEVTDRHTKIDFAEQMKYLVDEAFPQERFEW